MKGKKKILANIFYYSGLLPIFNRKKDFLIVFNYHRIKTDSKKDHFTDFDHGVFGPTQSEFEEHIVWLKKHTTILSEKTLYDIAASSGKFPGRCSMITFDDGYIDNYTMAYPVLKKYNVPAIFFIPTDPINHRRLGWWDLIAYFIKNTEKIKIKYADETFFPKHSQAETINAFLLKMKLEKKHDDLLERLSDVCEVRFPSDELQSRELMTWEQINVLSDNNISIGSHTCSHRVLATLDNINQKTQMEISKSEIERKINKEVISISYPVGNYSHFTEDTKRLAHKCGYKLGFSFNTGVNSFRLDDVFDIRRAGPPNGIKLFAASTAIPELFVWRN